MFRDIPVSSRMRHGSSSEDDNAAIDGGAARRHDSPPTILLTFWNKPGIENRRLDSERSAPPFVIAIQFLPGQVPEVDQLVLFGSDDSTSCR